ncbi:MAG: flagellar hook assembly protein FlgD [Myxococcales bacterium]|nr:flagellar hook assembly protein FlgD [Myxococcales bacterium]
MNVQNLVNETASANTPSTADRVGSKELGKDQFLKLMLAQLQNQDPTQPQDSQAFVAQLAQFSSVEQLENANTRLDDILMAQASNSQIAATSFVGKQASFVSESLTLNAGQPARTTAQLQGEATEVTASIYEDGKVVRTLKLGPQTAGPVNVTWDGRREDGSLAGVGTYKVELDAKNKTGDPVGVSMRQSGSVDGVSFENGAPELLIDGQRVSMSQVIEINQRSNP